jgi:FlaA1/EpsC-like NDP-sugar epimerase
MIKTKLKNHLTNRSRTEKRLILIMADFILLPFSLWLAFSIRQTDFYIPDGNAWLAILLAPVIALPIFIRSGMYRAILRYLRRRFFTSVLVATALSAMLWAGISFFTGLVEDVFPVVLFYWLISFALISGIRLFSQSLLYSKKSDSNARKVLIYGAGSSGVQLAPVLASQPGFDVKGFIDDDISLKGWSILGLPVMNFDQAKSLLDNNLDEVILAMPSANISRRQEIINTLAPYPIKVRTLPALIDIASGKIKAADIRDIDIDDLLGRQPVAPDANLLPANIHGKTVMVTGSGGSIGSELCRQIIKLAPKKLVLFELSEFALYNIEQELQALIDENHYQVDLIKILGSVANKQLLDNVFKQWGIQTIYHAAAYKHVPLVEENPASGISNNIFGTKLLAETASAYHVETFILISTDKAVRPTNVMGCTKRVAEMMLQALTANKKDNKTIFSMVRFGNVLGSSGSVVPKFREQIAHGGPITVTHKEITRYFMVIPEAVQLVIQAGAMAKGGEVFVLDMGDPVKIADLAEKMVLLSGLKIRTKDNPDGEIAIEYTGLRPGEKLYEELLIGDNVSGTSHPRIMQANEKFLPWLQLQPLLDRLEKNLSSSNVDDIKQILTTLVEDYKPWKDKRDTYDYSDFQKNIIHLNKNQSSK